MRSLGLGSVAILASLGASLVHAQQAAPESADALLKKKQAAAAQAAKPAAPVVQAVKPAAAQAAKPAAPVAQAAKPAAGAAPVPPKAVAKGAKPTATPGAVAQKLSPAARRAAQLAIMTAQPVPPVHAHVSRPYAGTCANPDALGTSRVLEVDTTGGLYVGVTYSAKLPLAEKEVVLTFDDGPSTGNTERVLAALEAECVKATFFMVGRMAQAHPEMLRKVAAAGHTIGYHSMNHPFDIARKPFEYGVGEMAGGWKVVDQILYGKAEDRPSNSFFRYPGLINSRNHSAWLNGMDMGIFAIDAGGNDWLKGYLTATEAPNVMNEALRELDKANGGILLLHDIKESSSRAVAPLLRELKTRGYKIVHAVPKRPPLPLVDGAVTGSIDMTQAPLAQRSVVGFDAGQQLQQEVKGLTGKTAAAPLPSAPGAVQAAVQAPANGQAAPATIEQTIAAMPARKAPEENVSWLASTGRSFRTIATAIGF